jgi:hypothetical protein
MNIKIAIPTYRRKNSQDTLDYLEKIKYPAEDITLFVQEEDEYKFHKNNNNHRTKEVVFKKATYLTEQLNNIMGYYGHGAYIVKMDDDIKGIGYLSNGKLKKVDDGKILKAFFDYAFATTIKNNTVIWGLYPVYNAFYMKDGYSLWALVMGSCMGIINSGERFDERFILKQDYELSCRVLKKYGKTVRFNNVAADAKHFDNPGGCKTYRDKYYDQVFQLILQTHGDILKPNPKRPNEILLRKK